MAVAFRAYTVASGNSTKSMTLSKPAGAASGDLLIVHAAWQTVSTPPPVWTVPSGWTLLRQDMSYDMSYAAGHAIFYKIAGSSEPTSYTFTSDGNIYFGAGCLAYSSPIPTNPISASDVTIPASTAAGVIAPTVAGTGTPLCLFSAPRTTTSGSWSLTAGTARYTGTGAGRPVAAEDGANGVTGNLSGSSYDLAATLILTANSAPNAPTLTGPATDATVDRGITQRFSWAFSDPDTGDSQSKFDLQYRIVGAPTWTTVTATTPNQFYDFAAASFASGDYEWQVRTYDSQGEVGPWSSSSFFTAADAPPMPTITAPVSGGTVASTDALTWSAPNQDAYEVRRVADNAGSADTGTVYYDSGQVTDATTRSVSLTFPTNDRYEHLQVRIKDNGLWSSWADIRVLVSYTPPPAPVVSAVGDSSIAKILVSITNPAPGAGQPTVVSNDLYISAATVPEYRAATGLPVNGSWQFPAASGVVYTFRAIAVASNGTTASS